ncbi:MAG: alpha/beta fold hydrolase [Bacillota bacterium]
MDRTTAGNFYSDFCEKHQYNSIEYKGRVWKYIASGDSLEKTLVLLHGGGMDAGMWAYQINELESRYKIIAPSFELLPDSFRLRSEALNYILTEEKAEHVILCGHSYGGLLAQYFISFFPENVEKIILAHTFYPTKGFIKRIKDKKLNTLKYIPEFVIKLAFKKRMKHCRVSRYNEFRNAYLNGFYSKINHKLLIDFYMTLVERLKEELPDISGWRGKALIINSKDDHDTIDKFQELVAVYPEAETCIFESGAHHTPMLFPEEFTEAIKAFVTSTWS